MENKTSTVRIVLLGSERTGKTSLVKKYIHSTFSDEYQPSFSGTEHKALTVDDRSYILELIPATQTGQDVLFQSGDAFILLYAVNDLVSLQKLRGYHQQIRTARTSLTRTPVFLVGTKVDLETERHVQAEDARQLAIILNCQKWFEVSSKAHESEINDMFDKLLSEFLRMQSLPEALPSPVAATTQPTGRPPMTPISSASIREPISPAEDSPRRNSNVFERLKFGSIRRKNSLQSLTRKKSGSFSEMMTFGRGTDRDGSRGVGSNNGLSMSSSNQSSSVLSPFRLDVDTSAWRDTVKWPTEIIPEEEVMAK